LNTTPPATFSRRTHFEETCAEGRTIPKFTSRLLATKNNHTSTFTFLHNFLGKNAGCAASLSTIESLFEIVKYRFWSGEAIPGVRRPVIIRVCTAYSIAATWSVLREHERGQAMLRSAGARRLRKTLRRCPAGCWGKNSPEKCLVDLGRDTRTSTQSRRLVRRKDAGWSPN